MIGDNDFVWTFPTFLLARNFVVDPATGDVRFGSDLQFIAPLVNPRGEQGIAMFTDRYLAEEYLALCKTQRDMRLMKIPDRLALINFLRNGPKKYRWVAVDPNRKTGMIHAMPIQGLLRALEESDDGMETGA